MPRWSKRRKCTSMSKPAASLPAEKRWPIVDGAVERNVLHGDRYVIEGVDKVTPNAKVCVDVDADRFLQLFVSRIQRK